MISTAWRFSFWLSGEESDMARRRIFEVGQPRRHLLNWGDALVLLGLASLLYAGVRLAVHAPAAVAGPEISLAPGALPWYSLLSVGRMAAAYALSMLFALIYGYLAARRHSAELILMPLLDVLQSVPILSFLPVVLLSLSAVLPEGIAAELASIILIFTSQAWNLAFAWYQSLNTVPTELSEASATFRLTGWLRFKTLDLPFAALSLLWNSMMSWAGGWFFLMAAEIFSVGQRDFRLPGLGAYLQEAASRGDLRAILWGIVTLVLIILALDQLVWRPLLAWADRFKVETVEGEDPPTSWFYDLLRGSRLVGWVSGRVLSSLNERLDAWLLRRFPPVGGGPEARSRRPWPEVLLALGGGLGLAYAALRAGQMLVSVPLDQWREVGVGVAATLLRVLTALAIALAWTVPLGVAIGTNRRLARWLQPVVQVIASVPATALFPVFVLLLIGLPGGLNLAAVLLMLMGTQWYLLFNVIAGASAIPQDLRYTTALLQLGRWERWRALILPALFPYIVTGAITASGGAWNASIVAEYVQFGGRTLHAVGIGALIAEATAAGGYPLLLAATLSMVLTVALINRLVWRRMYRLAEDRFRME
jgi:NitT/TauT family transport system permease protein